MFPQTALTTGSLWALRPEGDFSWREWDGELVVFVAATGDTHALSPVASLLLKTMLQHPGDGRPAGAWFDLVSDEPAAEVTDAEAQAFEQLLHDLRYIGLVEKQLA